MPEITSAQLRKIYMLAHKAGMDNDLLHIYVQNITGKTSMKNLTIRDAIQVIDRMEGRENRSRGERHMTDRQMSFMLCLLKELGWVGEDRNPDMDRLNRFVKARFGVDHYRFLSSRDAGKVIEALKAMLAREREEHVC